ncbi:MAG TPA: hypothetical protein VMV92_08705 [Streptosporangiaceae bacterium]|nr:hypothetical protein [Streptosporangiaceae bacterium]
MPQVPAHTDHRPDWPQPLCSSGVALVGPVLDAATAHAAAKHGHEDTPQLREMLRAGLEDAEPARA